MTITISADDPRSIRAVEIAAEADQWLKGRNRAGEEVYGIPSQSEPGRYYIVTGSRCDCPDFRRLAAASWSGEPTEQHACKHLLAVRLHTELVKAQLRQTSQRRRDHLSVVPKPQAG